MSAQHELDGKSLESDGENELAKIFQARVLLAKPFHDMDHESLSSTQLLIRKGSQTVAYKPSVPPSVDIRSLDLSHVADRNTIDGLRFEVLDLYVPKFSSRYRVYAARSLSRSDDKITLVRHRLQVLVPLGLGLAALAGYFLASRVLAPLTELTRTLDTITTSNLKARVKLTNTGEDIAQLGGRFNSLLDRLDQSFSLQRRFMADASHELRTPVTVALAAVQLAAREPHKTLASCQESLEIIEQQMLRMKRLVGDMLFLSQADASPLAMQVEEIYLDDVVLEASRAGKTLANMKHQTLRVGALREARCLGDAGLLKQAFVVLLENAVKYTPIGGKIEVNLCDSNACWVFSVSDSGRGILPEDQPHVFERFFRGAQAQRRPNQPGRIPPRPHQISNCSSHSASRASRNRLSGELFRR